LENLLFGEVKNKFEAIGVGHVEKRLKKLTTEVSKFSFFVGNPVISYI